MDNILEIKNVSKNFKKNTSFAALKEVSFCLAQGEILGIVGESGSGKTTLARIIANLIKHDIGSITHPKSADGKRADIQMIFQSSENSFNPKLRMRDSLTEPLIARGRKKEDALKEITVLLKRCDLSEEHMEKYPNELSGGQCQRAAVARAVSVRPEILICDEVTSALDEKNAKQVIELLLTLKEESVMSYIFISHDIKLIGEVCSRVVVMKDGEIVEEGKTEEVFSSPKHSYTKLLIESVL